MKTRIKNGSTRTNENGDVMHRIVSTLDDQRFNDIKDIAINNKIDVNSLIKFSLDKVIRYYKKNGELPTGIELQKKS